MPAEPVSEIVATDGCSLREGRSMSDDQMKHSFKMPVGAWGYWGHRQCEYYYVACNRSVDEVREVHFSCVDVLGFSIGQICGNYRETEVNKEIYKKLKAIEIDVPVEPGAGEIFKLWMDILQHIDPSLRYEIIDPPDLAFIGIDSKGRKFDAPGYGIFE